MAHQADIVHTSCLYVAWPLALDLMGLNRLLLAVEYLQGCTWLPSQVPGQCHGELVGRSMERLWTSLQMEARESLLHHSQGHGLKSLAWVKHAMVSLLVQLGDQGIPRLSSSLLGRAFGVCLYSLFFSLPLPVLL